MKTSFAPKLIAACTVFTWATASLSHVVLQEGVAAAGARYRATLQVGHGCDGSPTAGIRVSMPAGFNGAQPMPKPGWTVTTKRGTLAEPYQSHGKTFSEGVVEINWTANGPQTALPADFYDEFVWRGTTPTKPGPLWFPVVQSCAKGVNAWVEVPASGTATHGLKAPAALLEVLDIQGAGHAH